ncbi:MAG: ATP-binding cassette domain-containing protein, partial [Acidobacteriota bacterium]
MAEDGTPLVQFQDLAVSYGLVQALAGISGEFRPGPTGLLGPNGAGKTTLLKTLLGFLDPDRGRMTAFGLDPTREP